MGCWMETCWAGGEWDRVLFLVIKANKNIMKINKKIKHNVSILSLHHRSLKSKIGQMFQSARTIDDFLSPHWLQQMYDHLVPLASMHMFLFL